MKIKKTSIIVCSVCEGSIDNGTGWLIEKGQYVIIPATDNFQIVCSQECGNKLIGSSRTEADYNDPKFVDCFREVVRKQIIQHRAKPRSVDSWRTIEIAVRHYPDDIERQLDFHTCVAEIITEGEKLGYGENIPRDLAMEIARKHNVAGAFIVEMI